MVFGSAKYLHIILQDVTVHFNPFPAQPCQCRIIFMSITQDVTTHDLFPHASVHSVGIGMPPHEKPLHISIIYPSCHVVGI